MCLGRPVVVEGLESLRIGLLDQVVHDICRGEPANASTNIRIESWEVLRCVMGLGPTLRSFVQPFGIYAAFVIRDLRTSCFSCFQISLSVRASCLTSGSGVGVSSSGLMGFGA